MHHRIKLKSNQSDLTGSAFGVFGLLAGFTILAGALTMAAPVNAGDNDLVDSFDIQILAACTMATTNTPGNTYATSMMPGASTVLGDTSIKTVCNDSNGYSIYTVGFSGNSYTGNNNKLIGSTGNINTGTSGSDSYWAMKILPDGSTYVPTIVNGFDSASFHEVPASFTQAVKLTSATDAGAGATGSNVKASYKISLSSTQVADTYTGKVRYTLVHPNTAPAPTIPPDMQSLTSSSIAALLPNIGDTATVRDSRDGNEYTIAKLDDGNYWMTDNLRLGKGNGEIITLTSADSNISSGRTFDLKASGVGTNPPDATGDCTVGFWEYEDTSYLCINTERPSYGVYYSWYAATAGTGLSTMGEAGDEDATDSICPKGWHLPSKTGNGNYDGLASAAGWTGIAGTTAMQQAPYNFTFSKVVYGEGFEGQYNYGDYWLSTIADGGVFPYSFFFDVDGNIRTDFGWFTSTGLPIRCVFGG